MEEIKNTLDPLTTWLPDSVRDFLDAGGWWIVLGVLALILLLILWSLLRRLFRLLFGKRSRPMVDTDAALYVNLEECPLPMTPPGNRRLFVYHVPARIRLVVVAPAGQHADLDATAVEKLLDRIIPGLGTMARTDRPRIRVWPPQLSHQGFAAAFHRRTPMPYDESDLSRWVLTAGKAMVGRQPILLGLGLWADEPCSIGRLTLEPGHWLDVLRLRDQEE